MFLSGKKGSPFLLNKITSNAQEEENLRHRLRVRSFGERSTTKAVRFPLNLMLTGTSLRVWSASFKKKGVLFGFTPQNNKLNAQEEPVPQPC